MPQTRRHFLLNTTAALAGLGVSASLPGLAPARVAPSDKVRVALIGCKGMGWANLRSHLKLPDVEMVALCDVDGNVLDERAAELTQLTGKKPLLYRDYRKLLENQDVDAVISATPDHWHALTMIHAAQAGKDVYVEKPLANTIEECDAMVAAAKRYGRVVQVGQWQRSGPHWDDATAFVQSGALGKIRTVKAWSYVGWVKDVPVLPDEPVPAHVDYDLWLGPAPERPFNRNRFHFTFRWFWDYAGGLMTDWGVHLLDMALKGMNVSAPNSVVATGGKFAYPHDAMETPDTLSALYEFDGFNLLWEHAIGIAQGPYGRDHGVAFIGNNGTLVVDRAGWEVLPEMEGDKPRMEAVALRKTTEPGLDLHTRNFIDCVKTRRQPVCNAEVGRHVAVISQLGNASYRVGRKVYWDAEARRFKNDDEANALTKAHYRAPWELPVISA